MNRTTRMGALLLTALAPFGLQAATFSLVSLRSDGTPPSNYTDGSNQPAITSDGRYVAFIADAPNLVTPNATGAAYQVYLRDRVAGTTELISATPSGLPGNSSSSLPSISDDGCKVAFMSFSSDLVAGDSNGGQDFFVRSRCVATPATSLASVSTGGVQGNAQSYEGRIAADGRKLVFISWATNLVTMPGVGNACLFERDLVSQVTSAITTASGACIVAASPDLSRDGSRVVFWAYTVPGTSNLTNGVWQIYLYDFNAAAGSQPVVVSTDASGAAQGQGGEGASTISAPAISTDGGYVAFRSRGSGLVAGNAGGTSHVYVKELASGTVVRASVDSSGNPGNADSSGSGEGYRPGLSRFANTVTFLTNATNLAAGTGGLFPTVVAHNFRTGQTIGFSTTQTIGGVPAIADAADLIVAYSGLQLDPAFASRGMFVFSGAVGADSTSELALSQAAAPNPASAGKDVMFTLTVTNNGPATANTVTLTNPLPAGSSYVWASPGCSVSGGTVTCSRTSLASVANTVFKIVARPAAAGSIVNNASVAATEPDSNSANNSVSTTVTVNSTPVAAQVLRYRLYSDVTKEHHFTTDLNEYTVLGGNGNWVQEGTVGKVLNNPGSFGGVAATPYYRLYDTSTQWHHWTTDANEYYTLIQFPNWNAEGVDGYILPTQAPGSVPLYRLLYPFVAGLHHWTIDANEYNTLITPSYGWIGEGGSGFVIP